MAGRRNTNKQNNKSTTSSTATHKISSYLRPELTDEEESSDVILPLHSPSSSPPADVAPSDLKTFLREELDKQTSQICSKIDSVKEEVADLFKRVSSVESSVESMSKSIDDLGDKMASSEQRLRDEIDKLREKLLISEMYSRKSNLLIYGVPNTVTDVDKACRNIFKDKLHLDSHAVDNMLFVNIHRLPRFTPSEEPNPIIIKFVRMEDRDLILKTTYSVGRELAQDRLSVRTDLPVDLKKLRGRLVRKAAELRKQQLHAKVREKGIVVTLYYRKDARSAWKTLKEDEEPRI